MNGVVVMHVRLLACQPVDPRLAPRLENRSTSERRPWVGNTCQVELCRQSDVWLVQERTYDGGENVHDGGELVGDLAGLGARGGE